MYVLQTDQMSPKDRYKVMSGTIVPRPIAFVTTKSTEGEVINAAPFSFFNMLAGDPPLVSIAVGRRNGTMKDTARNAIAHNELVIHVVSEDMVENMNETAATLKADESELARTSLNLVESKIISTPGIKEARVRFECVLENHLPTKNDEGAVSFDLLIARVKCMHIDEAVFNEEKKYIDLDRLKPVARLAGPNYAHLGERYSIRRPD
ncbi:flavin reductase family protein [Bacillus sp. JCM 19041]|uniref:flavin reductase family protein n=1 Tax=Bacillus sp. JCM 19041 TaxID=1460637 RepID=UPI0006D0A9DB